MSNLLNSFKTSVNNISSDTVPVVNNDPTELPYMPNESHLSMNPSYGNAVSIDAEKFAEITYEDDVNLAESREETLGEDTEHTMSFAITEIRLPAYFESYDDLATAVVGNVMRSEGVKSLNCSYFGEILRNTAPSGYSRTKFGRHEFFVQEKSDRVIYVFDFLARAKEALISEHRYECPLVDELVINGVLAYSLVLNPKELMDIQRSYPSYTIMYKYGEAIGGDVNVSKPRDDISRLRLLIKA